MLLDADSRTRTLNVCFTVRDDMKWDVESYGQPIFLYDQQTSVFSVDERSLNATLELFESDIMTSEVTAEDDFVPDIIVPSVSRKRGRDVDLSASSSSSSSSSSFAMMKMMEFAGGLMQKMERTYEENKELLMENNRMKVQKYDMSFVMAMQQQRIAVMQTFGSHSEQTRLMMNIIDNTPFPAVHGSQQVFLPQPQMVAPSEQLQTSQNNYVVTSPPSQGTDWFDVNIDESNACGFSKEDLVEMGIYEEDVDQFDSQNIGCSN